MVRHAPALGGRLLLVRHAHTVGNANGHRMGRHDLPLDDVGQHQVRGLSAALQAAVPAYAQLSIYSSPLLRATQTISPFAAARGLRVHVDGALVEMDFGDLEGGAEPRPKLWLKERHVYDPLPGGESLFQVWERAAGFFARVRPELDSGGTVLVVAHNRLSKLLAGVAAGADFESHVQTSTYKPDNASVFEMTFSPRGGPVRGPSLLWSPNS